MASGLSAALTGRTHGCTDQPAKVKKALANSEPSTHGTKRTCRGEFAHVRLEGRTGPRVSDDAASAFGPKADIGRTGFRTERAHSDMLFFIRSRPDHISI